MGRTEVSPGTSSGVHHHGHSETGIYVPPYLPHLERNPSPDTPAVVVVVRTTQEAIVESLDALYPLQRGAV